MASLMKLISPNVLFVTNRGFIAQNPGFANTQVAFLSKYSRIVQKLGIPDRPKQPRSAFLRYLEDFKESTKLKTLTDRAIQAGIQWKQLTVEQKEKYKTDFKKEYAEYRQKYNEYKKNLTPEQKEAIKTERKLLKNKQESAVVKKTLKNELSALGKPKKPITSFAIFVAEKCKNTNLRSIDVKDDWAQLNDEQKQVYKNKSLQLRNTYEAELKKWEDKMMVEDKGHLVRKNRFLAKNEMGIITRKPRGKANNQKSE